MNELVHLEVVPGGEGELPEADLLVVGCFENEPPSAPPLPEVLAGAVDRAAGRTGFAGREKQWVEVSVDGGPVQAVAVHGLGRRDELHERDLDSWIDRVLDGLRTNGAERVLLALPDCPRSRRPAGAERICRRLALGAYRFDRYKERSDRPPIALRWIGAVPPDGETAAYRASVGTAGAIAAGVVLTRDLANSPANVATPAWMEERAREVAEEHGMEIEVLGPEELEERGMGGILAVGRGSAHPPRLVRLAWGTAGPRVALVGKGVTFDTGGISIKPAPRLDEMKYDKTGACTVLGVARAVARLELPVRLACYLPLAENMPDGAAYRPGDIIRAYNGKTIEIINTDAEGRLILADALSLAVEEGAEALLEFSTLTGACVVALGHHGAGLFSPDDELAAGLLAAAGDGGERLWRLPLWHEFLEEMRGTHADLQNSGSRWGGASTAAAFLSQFVGDLGRWAHLDIAGPSQIPKEHNGSCGATGYGVALAVHWLRGLTGSS